MPANSRLTAHDFDVDPKAWRGLSIGVIEQANGFIYCLRLVRTDFSSATNVLTTECEAEAVASWRYWTSMLGLPRLVEKAPNEFDALENRLGELLVRVRQARRRGSPLFNRRPRRMSKRIVRKIAPSEAVYRQEREIIARN